VADSREFSNGNSRRPWLTGTVQKALSLHQNSPIEMQKIDIFLGRRHITLPDGQTRPQWGGGHLSPHPALLTPSSFYTPPTPIGVSILAPTALELGPLPHLLILEPHCMFGSPQGRPSPPKAMTQPSPSPSLPLPSPFLPLSLFHFPPSPFLKSRTP